MHITNILSENFVNLIRKDGKGFLQKFICKIQPENFMVKEKKSKKVNKSKPKKKYAVIMHNDNVTPIEFVILLLMNVFNFDMQNAVNMTFQVHNGDKMVIAIYPEKLAYAKQKEALSVAASNGFNQFNITVEEV